MAVKLSGELNVKFGIVEHPGPHTGIQSDDDLVKYIENLRKYPVYIGLQPMYRNWSVGFSKNVLYQLDFVLMDADTIPLGNNAYLEIWRHNNYIEDISSFMDLYMNHIENILKYEPITIFARPTYLPVNFARYYDALWTTDRVQKIIKLAKDRNIAFEISTPMHVPKKEIIIAAKNAGLKFTFGTNARNKDAGKLHYGLQMVEECGLTRDDLLIL
jgi:histidinol phosphatase-like PHP family hydrolase